MANGVYRIGIVGASSLAGKELADVLSESLLGASDFVLLDDEELTGQITAAGDEVAVIQRLDASSFDRMDFAFFTNSADVAAAQWQSARQAGASIVDLTYALEGQKDVLVLAPWVEEALVEKGTSGRPMPDLGTAAVVAAHPAAVILTLLAARLKSVGLVHLAATVMEPASEYGRPAMDELHQQTVNLLSFQALPKEQYDAQVSFNLLPALGETAKIKFAATQQRIVNQYQVLSAGRLPELTVQLVHAPVFHGYVASVLIELAEPATVTRVEAALLGAHVDVVTAQSDPPSNLSAAGQENILIRVTKATMDEGSVRRFWIWLAADNLKLHMLNAVACALELRRLRPQSTVQ